MLLCVTVSSRNATSVQSGLLLMIYERLPVRPDDLPSASSCLAIRISSSYS